MLLEEEVWKMNALKEYQLAYRTKLIDIDRLNLYVPYLKIFVSQQILNETENEFKKADRHQNTELMLFRANQSIKKLEREQRRMDKTKR